MSKRVAVVQSNYIPWKGYFDMIASVDEFVLFDDAQYTRRDWRNRNRIKTREGPLWLTIPVEVSGRYLQPIRETRISDPGWRERHWRTIAHSYAKAPCFREFGPQLARLYETASDPLLSQVNRHLLEGICKLLGITTRLSWSMDYQLCDGKTERLVQLCRQMGATEYLSGPTARGYIDEALFAEAGVAVRWMDYSGYPEYPQLFPPFVHEVSIVDVLLNTGAAARDCLTHTSLERDAS
ncbi:MAG TPA: WbqC family protein [Planctomycetota bacterium]|nr:WbqC family protein [Planctomycetota bacterium]